uniref:Ribosomal silencing factor RsfS n=1 Tax=Hemiselmis tepida TaxID=464990 RepID=A0A7S0VSN1_9CRYP|mmetsp:Transcript_26572/g.67496  ORF Transcript_26572/g.67496 Transcript_26572/m.67496 type:complete len:289 (+) Transcript_26572:47-913(+)
MRVAILVLLSGCLALQASAFSPVAGGVAIGALGAARSGNACCVARLPASGRIPAPLLLRKGVLGAQRGLKGSGIRVQTMAADKVNPNDGMAWDKYVKEGMEAPMQSVAEPEGPLEEDPSLPMIEDIIVAADERKGERIWAARVSHLTFTTSFFVNVEGTSRPMLQAIAANVEEMMLEKHGREIKWQGKPDSGWILLDYGDVIVNILTTAAREYYDLESLWKNGELIPLDHLVVPNFNAASDEEALEDGDWGSSDPFTKWDDWDEADDLSPSEKDLATRADDPKSELEP